MNNLSRFLREALTIWETSLGPEHPYVATSLNNLAMLYYVSKPTRKGRAPFPARPGDS